MLLRSMSHPTFFPSPRAPPPRIVPSICTDIDLPNSQRRALLIHTAIPRTRRPRDVTATAPMDQWQASEALLEAVPPTGIDRISFEPMAGIMVETAIPDIDFQPPEFMISANDQHLEPSFHHDPGTQASIALTIPKPKCPKSDGDALHFFPEKERSDLRVC